MIIRKQTTPFLKNLQRISVMKKKKTSKVSTVIFGLVIVTFLGVCALAAKDLFLKPAEQLEAGLSSLNKENYRKAERYLIMAGDSDDKMVSIQADYLLGELYARGGKGFKPNGKKAEMFLERAAMAGVPAAQYQLALLYDNGDKIPENREKALFWMNEAARAGDTDALYGLGVWLERGYMGKVPMDKVISLYEQAAANGQQNAMTSLIAIFGGGADGVKPDMAKSLYWTEKLKMSKEGKK